MYKILIVEDDKDILTGLVDNLAMEGYSTIIARDGKSALKQVKERNPDLIILDIMLPKLNGFEVCKELKKSGVDTPVIILSAKAQETDKVLALELGADDYVTKPFSPRELLVRVKAVLRRVERGSKVEDKYEFGGVIVDFRKMQAFRRHCELDASLSLRAGEKSPSLRAPKGRSNLKEVKLTAVEFKVLKLLIANKGEPVSRHKILAEIWTSDEVTTRTVDTHIWHLREKLENEPAKPKHIITVHRIGYKFIG